MVDWLKILLACIQAIGAVATWAHARDLLKAGGLEVIAAALKEQASGIEKAIVARDKVRADAARDPAGVLRDNDGWKRD